MNGSVPSSPHLFRPVRRAFWAALVILLGAAAWIPAPLGLPADPAAPPNPAKSAWFLLWIQELVSYRTAAIHLTLVLAALLVALPWLPIRQVERAAWLQRPHRLLGGLVLAVAAAVFALTLTGLFLRGPDWRLVSPF